jgi:hypothetical protein
VRINANFRWHLTPRLDLDLALNNLTNTNQVQFVPQDSVQSMRDRRTVQLKMGWRF